MELITERGRLDLYDDFSWSLNYKTADVVNLTGRKASFTKTVSIPYTKNNRAIFQGLDEWNVDNVGYNTKSSLDCFITHNGRTQMRGQLIILKFSKLKEQEKIEIQIISSIKTLVGALKKIKLNTLDFSKWNHEYTMPNIYNNCVYGTTYLDGIQTVLPQGRGYVYPLIDFGKDDLPSETQWKVTDMRPCLYLKEYVDTIFRFAEKTYTSDFFDSPYFRSIALENTVTSVKLSQNELNAEATEVENTVGFKTYTDNGNGAPIPPNVSLVGGDPAFPLGAQWSDQYTSMNFTNEITDPFGQWDITGNGIFTANRSGTFTFRLDMEFYHEYTADFQAQETYQFLFNIGSQYGVYDLNTLQVEANHFIQLIKNGSIISSEFAFTELPSQTVTINTTPWNLAGTNPVTGLLPYIWTDTGLRNQTIQLTVDLVQGDTVNFRTLDEARQDVAPVDTQAIIHRFNVLNTTCNVTLDQSIIREGDLVSFNNYVPDVNADKFIESIFNTFNMWVIDDPFDANNIIAEPRTNIFNGNSYLDMSKKLDISRLIDSDYLADKLPSVYQYKFKASDDLLNDIDNRSGFPYADFNSVVDIEYADKTLVIPTEFSPIISQRKNGLYYPLEYKLNGAVKENIGAFLKIGFVNRENQEFQILDELSVVTNVPSYNRISEFNDVSNPNYSLTFGDADEKIGLLSTPYWTLYRLFHQLTEEENTRHGSKIITAYFNLNENDIANLNLTIPWFVNGVYYRIVEISNFNPLSNQSTKVSLLQIEQPKFDFTSNQMIYKMSNLWTPVISDNNKQILKTLQDYVQPS
tara:strand:+ start:12865 stop:15276 length:2412 start_codon:yes stop_codon:yes gene_type:complete